MIVWTIRDPDPRTVLEGPSLSDGKIIINLNNRDYARDVQSGVWFGEAIAEVAQWHAPTAHIIKALNLVAMETLDTSPAALRAAGAQMFIAGNDATAKKVVMTLLGELGFETVDMGAGPVALRAVEALGDVIRLLMIEAQRSSQANLQVRMLPPPDLEAIGPRSTSSYQ